MFIRLILSALCVQVVISTYADSNSADYDDDSNEISVVNLLKHEFDFRILQKVTAAKGDKNIIISPISLKLILAILYEGSGGDTEKEFRDVLNFPVDRTTLRDNYTNLLTALIDKRNSYTVMNIGTQLFLDERLSSEKSFATKAKQYYRADIERMNFSSPYESSKRINKWVDHLTNGRIQTLVSPDDFTNAVLIAANAIYFEGSWKMPFTKKQTIKGNFYLSNNQVVRADYMRQTNMFDYTDLKELGAQILRLPYRGRQFALFIILPYNKDGLSRLIENLDVMTITRAIRLMTRQNVSLIMPKFRFDFQAKYSEILRDLGFKSLFGGISSFPGIIRDQEIQLIVTDILQKSGIDVYEEGSEIYSATQVTIANKFGGESFKSFNMTHPFLFFIVEQLTQNMLFMGKVENPQEREPPLETKYGDIPTKKPVTHSEPNPNYPVYLETSPTLAPSIGSHFDITLLQKSIGSSKNILISPPSIKVSLGMLAQAAQGTTATEIDNALRIPKERREEVLRSLVTELNATLPNSKLKFQNAVFVSNQQRVKENYKTVVEKNYGALVKQLDFYNPHRAATIINSLINYTTDGFIPAAVSPDEIDSNTDVILTNVLYFKADWLKIFEHKLTKPACFRTPLKCVDVKLMHIIDMFDYADTQNAYIVKLDYTGQKRAMLLVIPKTDNGLSQALRDVEKQTFEGLLSTLNLVEVELFLPQFEISYGQNIENILKNMNIRQVFEANSNLSNLLETDKATFVDSFLHKTKIVVSEEGTEASALSLVSVIPLMGTSTPKVRADHPFAFFVYNTHTKTILFEGILNEPENKVTPQQKTVYSVNNFPYPIEQPVNIQGRNSLPIQQQDQQTSYRL